MLPKRRAPWLLLLAICARPALVHAQCTPVQPVPCESCFAVFVMPDTQFYTDANHQPYGANHLDLVTRYICKHRTAWVEPGTGKQMPILMVIQLGDLVQSRDAVPDEWARIDAAFDNLDACEPVVPYLVTIGNHDIPGAAYQSTTSGFDQYFGADRWTDAGYGCADPADCRWSEGEWFIGGGDDIAAGSRNNVPPPGNPGPPALQPGRHRAGVIRAPSGQRFLFMGLELAFDFPPPAPGQSGIEGDDTAWPKQVLADYTNVPTVFFHHSMFLGSTDPDPAVRFGIETWESDSLTDPPGMEDVWDELVEPYPQAFLVFAGHVVNPTRQTNYVVPRPSGPDVYGLLRNYQGLAHPGFSVPEHRTGVGWNVIAAFDPEVDQIRVRSYRIDDEDAYADPIVDFDHTGEPAPTECFDTDVQGFGELTIPFDLLDVVPVPGAAKQSGALLPLLLGAVGVLLAGGLLRPAWPGRPGSRRRRTCTTPPGSDG